MDTADPDLAGVRDLVELTLALAGRIQAHYRARVAEFDLTPGEAGLLLALDAEQGRNMSELAASVQMDRSNLSSIIDRLQRRGLVTRHPDPHDGRGRLVTLTEAGRQTRASLEQRILHDNPALAGLNTRDQQHLRALLHRNQQALARLT